MLWWHRSLLTDLVLDSQQYVRFPILISNHNIQIRPSYANPSSVHSKCHWYLPSLPPWQWVTIPSTTPSTATTPMHSPTNIWKSCNWQLSTGMSDSTLSIYTGTWKSSFSRPHPALMSQAMYWRTRGRHEFQVVHKSYDVTSDDPIINPPFQEVQDNPSRRDTIMIPPGGSATLRWVADNPGAWMFHCHVYQFSLSLP